MKAPAKFRPNAKFFIGTDKEEGNEVLFAMVPMGDRAMFLDSDGVEMKGFAGGVARLVSSDVSGGLGE
jgi:hypothetical protein